MSDKRPASAVPIAIGLGAALLLAAGGLLYLRASSRVNHVSVADAPRPVSVVDVAAGTYQPTRQYVATIDPWVRADVGPQLIAAYVDTVLVRPGTEVKRGQVLATLDCRDASATQRAVSMQARAIDAKQKAMANEAARVNSLLDGGFVAPNEAEQKLAGSASELAELMSTQAKLAGSSLAVNDCVLKAPFDGEIASRMIDPGAFVRPGSALVSIIDRSTVRISADVPESDFPFVGPGTPVKISMLATGGTAVGTIARRSPSASKATRTVHFEIDLPDPQRLTPVGTTAELTIDVGKPRPATVVPGSAAAVRGDSATLFIVEGDRAKKSVVAVEGEAAGTLYLDPSLPAGSRVITEGRSLLSDGDRVVATGAKP